MLSTLCFTPLLGFSLLFFFDKRNYVFIQNFSTFWSLLVFNISVLLTFYYNPNSAAFQFVEALPFLSFSNNVVFLALDGISFVLVLLTTFLIPSCILLS
jgi:NADH-quinone oxidoreductase subunit M